MPKSSTTNSTVKELMTYWSHRYQRRAHDARLKRLPQFTTIIDGWSIQFVHLLLTEAECVVALEDSWLAGSFVEFLEVIESLPASIT
ncbi:epoxide hydrolase N-terminal domain-containing protein [Nocardia sp. NPDC059246]|uniref:epoxide hydrolase N-terminal domain-containing protein n=1 Tax=unclassified Nocardia TaxID=2637762 RepID=UPI0036CCE3CF